MEGLADICACPRCGRPSEWFVDWDGKQAYCTSSIPDCAVLRFKPDGTMKYIPINNSNWADWHPHLRLNHPKN